MKNLGHRITEVSPGSLAEKLGISAGSYLYAINGIPIVDIFDYRYLVLDEKLTVTIRKEKDSEGDFSEKTYKIKKEETEDLGLEFENSLMDQYRSCTNKCVFCFIDQNPKGMRDTIYFKDDDSRLSFMQGNYITLTNMSFEEIDRIIRLRLAPINISVHATDPELRCTLLHNRFAGTLLEKIDRFAAAEIPMNAQVVLCPGLNDGEQLNRTIKDLSERMPHMQSLSVVPVGLTKYREGLYPLRIMTNEEMEKTIDLIEDWQDRLFEKTGSHFVFASDEFYLKTGRRLPKADRYDGFGQIENGVGMTRQMIQEAGSAVKEALYEIGRSRPWHFLLGKDPLTLPVKKRHVTLATGVLIGPVIKALVSAVTRHFPGISAEVVPIRNDFFGKDITVSGLITGQDLIHQLTGKNLGEALLLPVNMFRCGEETFLDDLTKTDVETALSVPIRIVEAGGEDIVWALLGRKPKKRKPFWQPYELEEEK